MILPGQFQAAVAQQLEQVVRIHRFLHLFRFGDSRSLPAWEKMLPLRCLPPGTVAAGGAGIRRIFPKVAEDEASQALCPGAVGDHIFHAAQVFLPHRLSFLLGQGFIGLRMVDHPLGSKDVCPAVEQDTVRPAAVPSGTACLLIVGFHGAGHVVMNHIIHVGLINAHAEGIGSHHDLNPVFLKGFLIFLPAPVTHACMIGARSIACLFQLDGYFLHSPAGGAINNAALVFPCPQQALQGCFLILGVEHVKEQIGAVKAGGSFHRVLEAKQADNVAAHLGGSGSRKRPHRGTLGQSVNKVRNLQIAGAEILPPLGNTVGFIHGNQADRRLHGKAAEGQGIQPLRRHVDDAVRPLTGTLCSKVQLPGGQAAVQVGGRHAGSNQAHDLILHEGNQGRNHQSNSRGHQGRNLIAHAFSGAGGHDPQCVPMGKESIHQHFLPGAKLLVSEVVLQRFLLIHPASPFRA